MKFIQVEVPPHYTYTEEERLLKELAEKAEKMTLVEYICALKDDFYQSHEGTAYLGTRNGPTCYTITREDALNGFADYSYTYIYWLPCDEN